MKTLRVVNLRNENFDGNILLKIANEDEKENNDIST